MAESPSTDDLLRTVKALRRELAMAQEALHRKNLELDALHFVWCAGGCASGIHRWDHGELTEAIVVEAERNTTRLRQWWTCHQSRVVHEPQPQG